MYRERRTRSKSNADFSQEEQHQKVLLQRNHHSTSSPRQLGCPMCAKRGAAATISHILIILVSSIWRSSHLAPLSNTLSPKHRERARARERDPHRHKAALRAQTANLERERAKTQERQEKNERIIFTHLDLELEILNATELELTYSTRNEAIAGRYSPEGKGLGRSSPPSPRSQCHLLRLLRSERPRLRPSCD